MGFFRLRTAAGSGGGASNPFNEDVYPSYTTYVIDPLSGNDTTGTGSDAAPWKTLQKGVDQLTAANRRVLVKATATITSETVIFPANTGTSTNARVALLNYPGQRPVLAGCYIALCGQSGVGDWNSPYATLRGLQMRDNNSTIVEVFHGQHTDLIVEYIDFYNLETTDTLSGANAPIYFTGTDGDMSLSTATIRQNYFRHIRHLTVPDKDNVNGIGAYDARNLLIHNNWFDDIEHAALRQKRANSNTPNGATFRNNYVSGMSHAVKYNISGAGNPRHEAMVVLKNLMKGLGDAVFVQSHETATQSTDLTVSQNTFAENTINAIRAKACTAVKAHSNAYLNSGNNYLTDIPTDGGHAYVNTLTESNYNGYRRKAWSLFTASSYTDLTAWQALTGITEIAATEGVRDTNSVDISADTIATHFPNYTNGTAAAYRLDAGSSLKSAGKAGVDIGYDPDDCGPSWSHL